jgi:hypothetical protein
MPYAQSQDILEVQGTGPFTTLLLPYRSGQRPADLSVTQSGGNLVITEDGGTTTVGASFYSYQDASQSALTAFGAGAASAYGMSAAGGPAEVVLSGNQVTITASGAAGLRTVTLPGSWAADPTSPGSSSLTFSGGQWQLNYQGGGPLTVTLVRAAPQAARLVVGAPGAGTAGVALSVTVTAQDANGHIATGYTGTVHFTSSDPRAVLPAAYTFTAADQGTHTFSVTLQTAGGQSITAVDAAGAPAGSAAVSVAPAAAAQLSVSAPAGSTAGGALSVTVTALDAYGNVATGYAGTLSFGSSDPRAVLPASYAFTAADQGTHTFSVTLQTAGGQSVTAADAAGALAGSAAVSVAPAAAAQLSVSAPAGSTAGGAVGVTVTALDAFGNVATGYAGTVYLTSSDPAAVLPAAYTFTAADQGTHTFSVTLNDPGTQSLTATDTAVNSVTGGALVAVALAPPNSLTATAVSPSQVNLAWAYNSGKVTGFLIERSQDGVTWTQIAVVGPGVTSYQDTRVSKRRRYYYRVRARNTSTGTPVYSPYSNIASVTTR